MADEVHVRAWRKKRQEHARRLPVPCGVCGVIVRPGDRWDLSHVKARALGGTALDGLFVAHSTCNQKEGPKLQWLVRQQRQTPNAAPSRDWFGGPPQPPPCPTKSPETVEPSRIW